MSSTEAPVTGWPAPGSLAFVCPRYGTEVLGGAERVVREMAEQLVRRDLPVEVLTTCTIDHHTWANEYEPGHTVINGVPVRRFPIELGNLRVQRRIGEIIGAGGPTTLSQQEVWLNEGARSAGLYHYLLDEHHRYHTIVLTPYMFWTTYACSQVASSKSILRPCLHDENFARLAIYRRMFRDVRGITFNSEPEARLARELFDLPERWSVVGEGVEVASDHAPERFRQKFGISEPFVLYAGRREWGKNLELLIDAFAHYRTRTDRPLKLVLLGKGAIQFPNEIEDSIVDLGFVSDQDKADAMAAATVLCQPSLWESFSRVLLEAWLAGTPTLVFGGCDVTVHHVRTSRGGLIFDDGGSFEVALDLLLDSDQLRAEMGRNGRRYVLEGFTWDQVMERFIDTICEWIDAGSG